MRHRRHDLAIAIVCALGTIAYLSALPRNLNPSDEAVHLYEAKRLLAGQVMYRDVFEIITPGWMYLMAALFWIFGTDISTARIGTAVLHAGTVVLMGLICRRLHVRPALAWATAFSYLALCQSAWPIASQHWLSTLLCVAVLFVLTAETETRWRFLLAGVLLGCVIGVTQQRGVIITVGIAIWCAADVWLARKEIGQAMGSGLGARWLQLTSGVLVVVGPLLLAMVAMAGFTPVWRALVVHPLVSYGGHTHCAWGYVSFLTLDSSRATLPSVLKWLPAVLVLTAARLAAGLVRRHAYGTLRPLTLLLVYCGFSALSIAYFPDFIHIAFITPLVLIAAAENAERLLASLPTAAIGRSAGALVAAAIMLVSMQKLRQNSMRLHHDYPLVRQTAFGSVAMVTPHDVELYEQIDALLDGMLARELYSYPIAAHWYLLADATNPTRYGFFLASYNTPDQVREVLDVLAAKRLPYIVSLPPTSIKDDPVFAYIAREYEPLPDNAPRGYRVYRRKGLPLPPSPVAEAGR